MEKWLKGKRIKGRKGGGIEEKDFYVDFLLREYENKIKTVKVNYPLPETIKLEKKTAQL